MSGQKTLDQETLTTVLGFLAQREGQTSMSAPIGLSLAIRLMRFEIEQFARNFRGDK